MTRTSARWLARNPLARCGALLGAWMLLSAATIPPNKTATPLADAAMRGEMQAVRSLIAQKANVNVAQGDGMTALHWAADRGDVAMAELLLRAGAKTTAVTRAGANTPLHVAARNGQGGVVKALLAAGADPSALTTGGATALHLAAASSSAEAVAALIQKKANVNARESEWGQTPLMFAASANRPEAVKVLLMNGAEVNVRTRTVDLNAQAAQESAEAKRRNEALLAFLPQKVRDSLKADAAKNAAANGGGRGGQATAAPVAPGAPAPGAGGPDASATPGAPPVFFGGGRPPAAPPTDLLTATQIQQAITIGRTSPAKSADSLAPRGADVIAPSDTSDGQVPGFAGTVGKMGGLTALHHAIRQGNIAATMALLDGGADINLRSTGDSTSPLLMATINGHFDLALQLVKRGADVKVASIAGLTPLYAAINSEWLPRSRFPQPQSMLVQKTTHLELMSAMIKAGADVNVRLRRNLWFFAYNNCGNANCGLEMLDGTTPFWRAAYAVDLEAMKLLKANGADVTIPSTRPVGGGRGGRGGGGGGGGAGGGGGGGDVAAGAAGAAGDSSARVAGARAGRGGGGGGRGGAGADGAAAGRDPAMAALFAGFPAPPPLDPAMDSAAKAFPPGTGVYPIHSAAGVGYGNGFAGNSHRHATDGWMPAMKYLVEELGADVNQRDLNGYTPMHHAAARGDNEMILYLVSKGADPKAVARNGRTTVDMANGPVQRLRPFPETIALLEKLGAKNNHKCVGC